MVEVILHIYDVTNGSEMMNNIVHYVNKIFKDGIGLGGIFHGAIQVYEDEEWSFGFCEQGTGVFSCPARLNTMYKYRKSIVLGKTDFNNFMVSRILRDLTIEWPGTSYDPLSKNCNHFCQEFCARLGVPTIPGWVNRFANAGDYALDFAENTALRFKQVKTELVSTSKSAYRSLWSVRCTNNNSNYYKTGLESPSNSDRGESSRVQAAWWKTLATTNSSNSCSNSAADLESGEVEPQQQT